MKFSIISPGWNCAKYVQDWHNSLCNQNVDWEAWVMDDHSTDSTSRVLAELDDDRVHVSRNAVNKGAAFSRWKLMKQADPDSIMVFLDLDDWLPDNCLPKILAPYQKGKLVTLGNYTTAAGGHFPLNVYSRQQIDKNTFYRATVFGCPPLRTFHGSLVEQLKETDFKVNGRWLNTCTDVALMWKIMYLVKYDDIHFFDDVMYVYRKRPRRHSSNRYDKKAAMRHLREKYKTRKHL